MSDLVDLGPVEGTGKATAPLVPGAEILPLDAFIRSVSVNAQVGHMLLLGAGASISSNIPSAANCIWQWKRAIFLSNHPGVEDSFDELSLPSVQGKIQSWIDQQPGYPMDGAASEYGFYIERCYPVVDDRRAFFQRHIQAARPSIGYRLAARLATPGLIHSVWTTNFDGLMSRALGDTSITPIDIGLDSSVRTLRPDRAGELPCIALHGDYRYDDIRNTDGELQRLDEELRQSLIDRATSKPLIVLGYSGRDTSIMEALTACYSRPGAGVLYWCGYGDGPPPEAVATLIASARKAGRTAFYVPGSVFDDVIRRLSLSILSGADRDDAQTLISQNTVNQHERTPFKKPSGRIGRLLKSTSYRLTCPVEAYAFKPKGMPDAQIWSWVREKTAGRSDLVVVPFKRQLWALGTLTAIRDVFGTDMIRDPVRAPLDLTEARHEDGAITHLLVHALAASLAVSRMLPFDGSLIWDPSTAKNRPVDGKTFVIQDAVLIQVRRVGQDTLLVMKPTVRVFKPNGDLADKEQEKAVKLGVFGWQHNDKFNAAVDYWRTKFFNDGTEFTCPPNDATGLKFTVNRAPIFAGIVAVPGQISLPDKLAAIATQTGTTLVEPSLLFGSKTGGGPIADQHPIRGLVANHPFDSSLTRSGLSPEVRLGVICPTPESRLAAGRLQTLLQPASPSDKERDYLLDFPGFAQAFGLPLLIPGPSDSAWKAPDEPTAGASKEQGVRQAAQAVIQAIDELKLSNRVNVVVIVTPNRWREYRSYETDAERFDLHDFVKAYCARKGIATQFLDESTLVETQVCRIRWWLSLALYAKSFRTPFVLKTASNDTAYVGFGTSVDPHGPNGRKVVLGCSHLFNEQGQGLQYRLSKVENPIFDFRRRNVFLSRDDARRVGESIRQLFFEARSALPSRVVIHKRSEFRRDEREGLLEGLAGIAAVDMIEINVDDTLRYLSSKRDGQTIAIDGYPVARGTVIPVSDFEALLWVHGSAVALRNAPYYQGKRRIPAPLRLRRHAGTTDLETIASEILGLSKMNWNTFDLYKQLPATIETSGQIARIGRLMEGYGDANYDYRLLM